MATRQTNTALKETLAQLEKRLETPVVPGELPGWVENAAEGCREVEESFQHEVNENHPAVLREIQLEDSELASRVEDLREEDQKLLSRLQKTRKHFDQLRSAANEVEPHESRIDETIEDATGQALALVIDIRKQETALTTWYMEALERDRGDVD